jgi:hypothetical protein
MANPSEWIVDVARKHPVELANSYRVVVLEGDSRITINDFDAMADALRYADDAASESDVPWPLAYVFAPGFEFVRLGRHYASA